MEKDSLIEWLALKTVPGVGNIIYKRLLDNYNSPNNVFNASKQDLINKGLSEKLAINIKNYKIPGYVYEDIELINKNKYSIITINDNLYPKLLLQIPDPPPVLYVYGNLDAENINIAIVGSRSATRYGLLTAHNFGKEFAKLKITIVSGMARGIDTAAHRGTLEGNGKTVAVLGCGLGTIYPPENKYLFHKIAQNGAVITEFPFKTKPEPHNFPARNRIISGLSLGTIVVEAGQRSGSLITARLALEQNREVFAVPGSINSPMSRGTNNLINQGAKLVSKASDVLEEIIPSFGWENSDVESKQLNKQKKFPELSDEQKKVFDILSNEPIYIDDICNKLSMDIAVITGILLQLELQNLVCQYPGKIFVKSEDF